MDFLYKIKDFIFTSSPTINTTYIYKSKLTTYFLFILLILLVIGSIIGLKSYIDNKNYADENKPEYKLLIGIVSIGIILIIAFIIYFIYLYIKNKTLVASFGPNKPKLYKLRQDTNFEDDALKSFIIPKSASFIRVEGDKYNTQNYPYQGNANVWSNLGNRPPSYTPSSSPNKGWTDGLPPAPQFNFETKSPLRISRV